MLQCDVVWVKMTSALWSQSCTSFPPPNYFQLGSSCRPRPVYEEKRTQQQQEQEYRKNLFIIVLSYCMYILPVLFEHLTTAPHHEAYTAQPQPHYTSIQQARRRKATWQQASTTTMPTRPPPLLLCLRLSLLRRLPPHSQLLPLLRQ
jgi:hypothetical protein